MDHYVAVLWDGSLSEESHFIVDKCIHSLFPTSAQYYFSLNVTCGASFLLKPHFKYIFAVNSSVNIGDFQWKNLDGENNSLDDVLPKEFNSINVQDNAVKLSEELHELADHLPAYGTFKFDMIIGSDVLKNISISDNKELAGSLYRLTLWHSVYSTIILQNPSMDDKQLEEWCTILNARIIKSPDEIIGPPVWRGSVTLLSPNAFENVQCSGFELKLDLTESNFLSKLNTSDVQYFLPDEVFSLSTKMEVVDICLFSSIPSYVICPLIFRLCLCNPNIQNVLSPSIVDHILDNKGVALIARIGYVSVSEKEKSYFKVFSSDKKFCTSKWKKVVSRGCIKSPGKIVYEDYISFVITKSVRSNNIIAYPFKDLKLLNSNFCLHSSNAYQIFENNSDDEDVNKNCIKRNLKDLLQVDSTLKWPDSIQTSVYRTSKDDDDSALLQTVLNKRMESIQNCNDVDPCDWPERVYLLNKQIQAEESKKSTRPNALLKLGPKLPQQSVSLSTEDIIKCFLPTGESKATDLKPISPVCDLKYQTPYSVDMLKPMKWPNILCIEYHDVYYNKDNQAEEKESISNQMANIYVQYQTSSTCSNQQLFQNYSIVISEKSHFNAQFRSPSIRKQILKQERNEQSVTNKNPVIKDLITKTILNSKPPSMPTCSKELSGKRIITNKHTSKRKEFPIRCSPRKKPSVQYSSSRRNNAEKKTLSNKSNELPDLLKRKLRNAVATALENQGISLNDASFRPCGKRLFAICQAFVKDISFKKGSTSQRMQKIADAHVLQVIEFEKQKES